MGDATRFAADCLNECFQTSAVRVCVWRVSSGSSVECPTASHRPLPRYTTRHSHVSWARASLTPRALRPFTASNTLGGSQQDRYCEAHSYLY